MEQLKGRFGLVILLLVVLALVTFGRTFLAAEKYTSDGSLKLWIFDIGQGDSLLIDTPTHQEILIDGGPDQTVLTRLTSALPLDDKTIDLVILTHTHADHLTGLNYVLGRYTVKEIWDSGATQDSATYRKFISLIAAKNIPVTNVALGAKKSFGALTGIVLTPINSMVGSQPANEHDANVMTYWQYGKETFLLTGDGETPAETALLTKSLIQPVDILKVGHHGSATSSSEAFLRALRPKIAVISVALHNKYNLPNAGVLARYQTLNIPLLQTRFDGTIEFSIWPDRFTYATHVN